MPIIDRFVAFTDKHGENFVGQVVKIWTREPDDYRQPLVDILVQDTGVEHTSVPYVDDTVGATGFFYS